MTVNWQNDNLTGKVNQVLACWAMSLMLCLGQLTDVTAHGILIESQPAHGATIRQSPERVLLRFNAKLEPSVTQVTLVDLQKSEQALKIMSSSTVETIMAEVPTLGPGVYNVNYKVLATDGHITEGFIRFTILGE